MVSCKTAVTPLLTHWSYCSFALSHRYALLDLSMNFLSHPSKGKTKVTNWDIFILCFFASTGQLFTDRVTDMKIIWVVGVIILHDLFFERWITWLWLWHCCEFFMVSKTSGQSKVPNTTRPASHRDWNTPADYPNWYVRLIQTDIHHNKLNKSVNDIYSLFTHVWFCSSPFWSTWANMTKFPSPAPENPGRSGILKC